MTFIIQADRFCINEVLACPDCHGAFCDQDMTGMLQCIACGNQYHIKEGIYHLMSVGPHQQEDENINRDKIAHNYLLANLDTIMQLIGLHHCIPIMQKRASAFRQRFSSDCLLLDLGGGWGYHWINTTGPVILLIDFSLGNLLVAKKLLSAENRVILIWADASHLPIRSEVISGVWSSQLIQFFPPSVRELFFSELRRVLRPDHFSVEIYCTNQAKLITALHKLGRQVLRKAPQRDWFDVDLVNEKILLDWFKPICQGAQVDIGYSELFFHPNLKFRPPAILYPEKLEHLLTKLFPSLVQIFARQIHINITL
jgi:ubiquinone/menaquinone biosynthesis C-methylase UbiE